MDIVPVFTDFSFWEVLTLVGVIMGAFVYVALNAIHNGFQFKKFRVKGSKEKSPPSNKSNTPDVLMLLETLKIKDDLARVDNIVWQRQKLRAREATSKAQMTQLRYMKNLLIKKLGIDEYEVLSNHDYLYYSLMMEKMYTTVLASMLNNFEQNSLSNLTDPRRYGEKRAQDSLDISYHEVIDPFYAGMTQIKRDEHEQMYATIYSDILSTLYEAYVDGVNAAKQGQAKKEELKTFIFEKVDTMDGISRDQIKSFFSNVIADDFLNIQR